MRYFYVIQINLQWVLGCCGFITLEPAELSFYLWAKCAIQDLAIGKRETGFSPNRNFVGGFRLCLII